MKNNLVKIRGWRMLVVLLLAMLFLSAGSGAYAYWYAAKVGCRIGLGTAMLGYPSGTAVSAGSMIQFIYTTDNSLNGPDPTDPDGDFGNDLIMNREIVGNDPVSGLFSGLAGKFWYYYQCPPLATTLSNAQVFCRVWSTSNPDDTGATYGESVLFTPTYNASQPITDPSAVSINDLGDIYVILAKDVPAIPTDLSASYVRGSGATPPTLNVSATAKLNTRSLIFEITTDESFSVIYGTYSVQCRGNNFATVTDTGKNTGSHSLGAGSDGKTWYYRVKAWNTYGYSSYATYGSIYVDVNTDNSAPATVPDLRLVTSDADSITLRWTAPNDTNSHGVQTPVNTYLVKAWDQTYYGSLFDTFGDDITTKGWTITYSPVGPYAIGGTNQLLTIEGIAPGLYNFQLKSSDSTPNWSGVSNMAAAKVGSGETVVVAKNASDLFITLLAGGDVKLTWEAAGSTTCEVLASSNFSGPYSVIATTDVAPFTYTDTNPGTKYYHVKVKGGGYAPVTAGKKVFTFAKAGGQTNVHTFSVPFNTSMNALNDPDMDLNTSTGIRASIQGQNSGKQVDYIGKWDALTQTSTADVFGGIGAPLPIIIDDAYQIAISPTNEVATWEIVGTR